MSFMVNRAAWDQLPSSYQEAFRTAAVYAAVGTQTIYDTENPAALQRLLAEGVQLRRFSPSIMEAAKNAAEAILEERAAADETYARIHTGWKAFREASFRWFGTAEKAYSDFAFPQMEG
jgi:TRAP-type mannitol/chloroaromatic compound transport system substrate-binding protein